MAVEIGTLHGAISKQTVRPSPSGASLCTPGAGSGSGG